MAEGAISIVNQDGFSFPSFFDTLKKQTGLLVLELPEGTQAYSTMAMVTYPKQTYLKPDVTTRTSQPGSKLPHS